MSIFGRVVGWFGNRGDIPTQSPVDMSRVADPVRAEADMAIERDNAEELARFDPLDDDMWPQPQPRDYERQRERDDEGLEL